MQTNEVSFPIFYKLANFLNVFIYTFHMPVFIALSGSIFALKEYSFGQLISKKCKRLLIPFFVVWIFWNLPIKYFTGYYDNISIIGMLKQMIFPSCVYLWYLECLFFVFVLAYFVRKVKLCHQILAVITCYLIGLFIFKKYGDYLFLGDPLYFLFWFYVGFKVKDLIGVFKNMNLWNTRTAIALFIFHVLVFIIGFGLHIKLLQAFSMYLLGPFSMILILNYAAKRINLTSKYVKTASDYSLGIYLYAEPINYLLLYLFCTYAGINYFGTETGSIVIYFSRIIVSVTVAIIITALLRKLKLTYLH